MDELDFRRNVLITLGANESEVEELLKYNENHFDHSKLNYPVMIPLQDEVFISVWKDYLEEAKSKGVFETLKEKIVQLNFPIHSGISLEAFYKDATLKGADVKNISEAKGLILNHPEKIILEIYESFGGNIPILIIEDRSDFVSFVQAIAFHNEPAKIPDSMGATTVKGYNNWDRINRYKKKWEIEKSNNDWDEEFKKIIPQTILYKDTFIILSNSYYSGVTPEEINLPEDEWKKKSLLIRRDHECTHYFTKRLLSSMENNLIDELIADYNGLIGAFGRYNANYFLSFVGLENYPEYRAGSRLENYKGSPPLSDNSFKIIQTLIKKSADNLKKYERDLSGDTKSFLGRAIMIIALTNLTLEDLASENAYFLIEKNYSEYKNKVTVAGKIQ